MSSMCGVPCTFQSFLRHVLFSIFGPGPSFLLHMFVIMFLHSNLSCDMFCVDAMPKTWLVIFCIHSHLSCDTLHLCNRILVTQAFLKLGIYTKKIIRKMICHFLYTFPSFLRHLFFGIRSYVSCLCHHHPRTVFLRSRWRFPSSICTPELGGPMTGTLQHNPPRGFDPGRLDRGCVQCVA